MTVVKLALGAPESTLIIITTRHLICMRYLFTLAVSRCVRVQDLVKSYVLYVISASAVVRLHQPHAGFAKL